MKVEESFWWQADKLNFISLLFSVQTDVELDLTAAFMKLQQSSELDPAAQHRALQLRVHRKLLVLFP